MRKLFLDDTRNAPDSSWDVVRSYDAFVAYITEHGIPDIISFDHDLADEHYVITPLGTKIRYDSYKEKTGYDCARWLCENGLKPKAFRVHSMNPVGRENIYKLLLNNRNYKCGTSTTTQTTEEKAE